MQYWLYAFKWGAGDKLIAKYETFEEAYIEMDRLNPDEYEYASILETDWQKEPKIVMQTNFEYRKNKVKRKGGKNYG